jgi:hypothetical protein
VTFLRGLLAARSHLAFLVGLAAAVVIVRASSDVGRAEARSRGPTPAPPAAAGLSLRPPAPLSARERVLAAAAWAYVERNTDRRTGLAASVQGHPSTTMWDVGSQLMAILAAEDLDLVAHGEARRRLARVLGSLAALPLGPVALPNKAYDIRTLALVDYRNRPAPDGIGWSALDLGRLFVPLSVITHRHPTLTPAVERAVGRWDLSALSDGAALRGASRREDGALVFHQEGRLGYEGYAAKALLPWGVPVAVALDVRAHLAHADVDGALVPHDDRAPRDHGGTHAAVVSEPWILEGLEFGFDASTLELARAVLAAQERRFARTARLTAVSEDAIDRPPWFTYSAVLNGPDRWVAFAPDGTPVDGGLGFSTKAALGWAVLFEGSYADRLLAAVEPLVAPGRGLYAGRYDATSEVNGALSLNTNAVALEALAYRVHGPFLRRRGFAAAAPRTGLAGLEVAR